MQGLSISGQYGGLNSAIYSMSSVFSSVSTRAPATSTERGVRILPRCIRASNYDPMMNCLACQGLYHVKPEKPDGFAAWQKGLLQDLVGIQEQGTRLCLQGTKTPLRAWGLSTNTPYISLSIKSEEAEDASPACPIISPSFFIDRGITGDTSSSGKVSEELQGIRPRLRMASPHAISCGWEDCSSKASQRLALDMQGELEDWFQKKDYFICVDASRNIER